VNNENHSKSRMGAICHHLVSVQ